MLASRRQHHGACKPIGPLESRARCEALEIGPGLGLEERIELQCTGQVERVAHRDIGNRESPVHQVVMALQMAVQPA